VTEGGPTRRLSFAALAPTAGQLRLVFAFAGALLVFNLLAFLFGKSPSTMLGAAFMGTWGTAYGVGQVMFKATPLLLTGLAFHVALRNGLFNIGTEGQLAMASLAGTWLATALPSPVLTGLPGVLLLPVVLAFAALVGAGYSAIAGVMRAKLDVHEIISGIMLNRCADVLIPWVLAMGLGVSGVRTADVAEGARLPSLDRWIGSLAGSAVSVAFPLAVLLTFAIYRWLERSRVGREMAWAGLNPDACDTQGIPVARRRVEAMLLSGALAGLVIAPSVLGYKGYFELGLGAGAGFSGIAVAMVGRGGPVQLILAALVFGTLAQAGLAINASVPKEAMGVLEAVVIILVSAAAFADRRKRGAP
jgi:simple sugar transport system permease protein